MGAVFWALIGLAFLFVVFILPFLLTIFNTANLFRKKPMAPRLVEGVTMILGLMLTTLLNTAVLGADFGSPTYISHDGVAGIHNYLATWHLPTLFVFAVVSIAAFFLLEYCQKRASPILSALCLAGVYGGVGLSVAFLIQLSNHLVNNLYQFENLWGWYAPSLLVYAMLFPINFILCSVRLIRKTIKFQVNKTGEAEYKSRFMRWLQGILSHSVSWLILPFILMLPLLGVLIFILTLFGQQPDAIIKVFTETSDWTLSRKTSPPPIQLPPPSDSHYLCTVAAQGDEHLVKPTRCGIRHGHKIIVNRQLCVANAFEQVMEEKLPKTHRAIRNFYDKHGYPLSKKITTVKRANLVYRLMKPLEWFFVVFLYAVDVNPENRIAMQYTKK